ncbi:Transposable element Tc1 transposase [Labeo rohita]|uniref:Transposable element Tc1 transposase n=1 Tax=Labeo rohita TaxID=84645 RepID=A0ABQ8MHH4_LABRO|nr:Transposable element Tc1 transposase [Labeo rohita]
MSNSSEKLDDVTETTDSLFSRTLDTVAPLRLRKIKENSLTPWYNEHTRALERAARKLERSWRKTKLEVLLLLDLSAVFDTVDHNILLNRLENYVGISGSALAWFKSYVSDRHRFVAVNEESAVSKHVNRKLSGRKKCGRKRCTTNQKNHSLERLVKQNRFKNLGELNKEWTEAGVKTSRATTHRLVKEFGYSCRIPLVNPLLNHRQRQRHLTWAKEKKKWTVAQWSKVLFSDESKFCISFGKQGPRVWKEGWRSS